MAMGFQASSGLSRNPAFTMDGLLPDETVEIAINTFGEALVSYDSCRLRDTVRLEATLDGGLYAVLHSQTRVRLMQLREEVQEALRAVRKVEMIFLPNDPINEDVIRKSVSIYTHRA